MGLTAMRRPAPARNRYELLQRIAHQRICKAFESRAFYAAELKAGTVTTNTDDGVVVEVIYKNADDVKRRLALMMGERDARNMQQRNMQLWNRCSVAWTRHAARNEWLQRVQQTAAAKALRDGITERAAHDLIEAAATDCARSKRRQAQPLARCQAMNAPNVLQVNETMPRCAAMTTKEAAP
jgi:hypothetical protein